MSHISNTRQRSGLIYGLAVLLIGIAGFLILKPSSNLPVVAIANYGPHASLESSIKGIKDELARQGFIDKKTIRYEIADVGFDTALIPQMIAKLKNYQPKVMIVMTTPVAQFAKGKISDVPLVYNVITDPVEAGLLKDAHKPYGNMTGSSDMQDLKAVLQFAKTLRPSAKAVGLLYSTSESNDAALVRMMRVAASAVGMSVVAVPVDQARDVPIRMQSFRGKVDFIYVGTSGPIQPTLPIIAQEARKMDIPVLNSDMQAVKDGLVLASFGVDYMAVGRNTGKLVASLLNGVNIKTLQPSYPRTEDHHGLISKRRAKELGMSIPLSLRNIEIVE